MLLELYIFSQDDELLTILSEDNGLLEAPINDLLNNVSDTPFVFTVEAQAKYEQSYDAKHNLMQVAGSFVGTMGSNVSERKNVSPAQFVLERNRVVFKDRHGDFREFVIDELDDIDDMDGPETTATCIPAWQYELQKNLIEDRRFTDRTAQFALDVALEGTRFVGEVLVDLALASTNFYRLRSTDAIWKIMDVWGGEFKDVVLLNNIGRISQRKIQLLQRRGADNGARFEIDHNMDSIERTLISDPVTAMYGWGASLEIEDEDGELTGGHTRYIDFKDVEWKVSNGDPVDKPLGQAWVGDPDALQKYGLEHSRELLHLYDEFSNQDYEDPEDLLMATWEHLQKTKDPEVNYRMSVDLLDKPVALGDTAQGIDRQFARPIEIQARVIGIEYDVLAEDPAVVEMGQFLSLNDDIIGREIDDIKEQLNRPSKPIDENSFPDIKPDTPVNVEAIGLFETIKVSWDYDYAVYVQYYEVYGSQVADFVPDSQHLLNRGDVSSYNHNVKADETWYYYVRAVNTRGTASDWSNKASASSRRIIDDDILFGEIKANHLANNLDLANKLSENTIDYINTEPLEEIKTKVTIDEVIGEINVSAETIKIHGNRFHITGQTLIDDGVIGTAAIADLAVDRFHLKYGIIDTVHIEDLAVTSAKMGLLAVDTAHISDAAITDAKIASLNVDKLTGSLATFIQTGFNNVTSSVQITGSGLTTYSNNARTSLLTGNGHDFYRNNLRIGRIGTSSWVGLSEYRGLSFHLTRDADYMVWSLQSESDANIYNPKLSWHGARAIAVGVRRGFTFNDDVTIVSGYKLTVDEIGLPGTSRYIDLVRHTWNGGSGIGIRSESDGSKLHLSSGVAALISSGNAHIEVGQDFAGNYVASTDISNRTTSSTNQMVRVGAGGVLQRSSSSRRYKLIEKVISHDYANKILELDPKSWYDKTSVESYAHTLNSGVDTEEERIDRLGGLIAEDVHDVGLGMYVSYDDQNRPDGLASYLWTLLIPVVRNLKLDTEDSIDSLKSKNKHQDEKVTHLEHRVKNLEKLLEVA